MAAQLPPPDDPITSRSLARPLLVAGLLLLAVLGWAIYQEEIGLRPWRGYQRRFAQAYAAYLEKRLAERRRAEQQLHASPEYQRLRATVEALRRTTEEQDRRLEQQMNLVEEQRSALLSTFQTARSYVGALTYEYEEIPDTPAYRKEKQERFRRLQKALAEKHRILWPLGNGRTEIRYLNYDQLNAQFNALLEEKARLMEERGRVDQPLKDAEAKLAAFEAQKLPGLSAAQLQGLLERVRNLDLKIRQVYVNPPGRALNYLGGGMIVDRCQSCHLGTDASLVPPGLTLTKADLGMANSHDAPFASHPEPELLRIHPVERFGCATCHGGNGWALDSVRTAHGRYPHWLWPLYYPENFQAGCQTCHSADAYTEFATVLNRGRYLYRVKGCIGCHKYQGFDDQADQLTDVQRLIRELEREKQHNIEEAARLNRLGDQAPDNATAQRYYAQAAALTLRNSQIDTRMDVLDRQAHDLFLEVKRVGPSLKEIRLKLQRDWIPYWLEHTHEFDPNAQMPQFRLQPEEVRAIAAFIWQDALKGPALPHQPAGDPARGRQLLYERGCLACHSVGEGTQRIGGDFAANLSREGEKANYDYLVRWIYNPHLRTAPYCPYEHRDLTPEDYARHGLPFVFDAEHSRCPNDGHELEFEEPTVMPSFRLSWQDARDIASLLMTQKHPNARYAPAPYMDDPKLFAEGRALVRFYGCAGCHEIAGLEDEGRIGTELTTEGSKPLDRLDFGFLLTSAKRGILPDGSRSPRGPWYDLKGFFDAKLRQPNVFDRQRYLPNPRDRLHMPTPALSTEDINALTSFLLGSVDTSTIPPEYLYRPTDARRAIQQGWWIITKYNCIGCHQIGVGQHTVLEALPQYQGENRANLPPILTFEGARVNPDWLKKFLANPALSTTDTNRNGVRTYLQVRMPTFFLSDDEIRILVSFFQALASQPQQFIPPVLKPLTPAEVRMAREIFVSPAAPCLKCHMTGNPAHDRTASAPNFLIARERLQPDWTRRWMIAPASMAPGTAMPSNLFRFENGRWVFNGPLPPDLKNYPGDQVDLLVRYMFQLTPQEQQALAGRTPAGTASRSSR